MNAWIVSGQVAFPGSHGRVLNQIAGSELHPRTDSVTVASGSDRSDGYPVLGARDVFKKGWCSIHVRVDDVNVPIIVEIRIGRAARGKQRERRQTRLPAHFSEDPRR